MDSDMNERDVYVSTILEDLFQYLDQGLRKNKPQYRSLNTFRKLRAAMRSLAVANFSENQSWRDIFSNTYQNFRRYRCRTGVFLFLTC